MRRRRSALLVPVLLGALLVGCSAEQPTSSAPMAPAPDYATEMRSSDGGMAESALGGDPMNQSAEDAARQVITTGRVTMTVDDARDAAREVAALVEGAGGRIDARSEQAPGESRGGSAELTVRIPADELTDVLVALEDVGTVEEVSQFINDVTTQARDLDARIGALEVSVARLQSLMADAQTTADLLAAEQMLTDRQSQLESLQSEQRSIADQVALSTFTIGLWEESTSPVPEAQNFWDGLGAGWTALLATLSGLLIGLGVALPWLVFLGVLLAVVLVVRRRMRRRRGDRLEATTPTPGAQESATPPPGPGSVQG